MRVFLLSLEIAWALAAAARGAEHRFDLEAIAREEGSVLTREKPGGFTFQPTAEKRGFELPGVEAGAPWDRAGFLVLETEHDNRFTTRFVLEFYLHGETEPRMTAGIATLPRLPTRIVLPLEALTKEEILLRPRGRQLTSQLRGRPVERAAIRAVRVRLQPFQAPDTLPRVTVRSVRLTDEEPGPEPAPETALVDAFGQWNRKDWPGKTHDEAELKRALLALRERAEKARWPEEWSRFGGWKGKRFEATGWFRTQHDGRRWWLVDPEGHAYLSVGPNIVRPSTSSRYVGLESLFAWLPEEEGPFGAMRERNSINFLGINLARVFGENWQREWQALSVGLLREWRFTGLGNSAWPELMERGDLPYTLRLGEWPHRYPSTERKIFRDFPDVFAPEFALAAKEYAQRLEPRKNDPWMVGYFMTNEPEWGFGKHNLALEMLRKAPPFHARAALAEWLRQRYAGDLARFNAAWGAEWREFDDARTWVLEKQRQPTAAMEDDLFAFSESLVRRYWALPAAELRAVSPHHLNLGVRYAYLSSDLCYAGAEVFDVFSLNSYNLPGPSPTAELARRTGKPVLIGEFHFGALDRGLPSAGLRGVGSQEERGRAYAQYLADALTRPEMVGAHYFQWNDQTITGRGDGEHYNIGLLDVCHRPYEEFVRALAPFHEAMYEIADGTRDFTPLPVTPVPSINTNQ